MKASHRTLRVLAFSLVLALALAGCSSLLGGFSLRNIGGNIAGTAVGAAMGNEEDKKKMETVKKTGEAVQSAAEEITPEQEYYVGRAVAATVLGSYPAYGDAKVNEYLNSLGQSLALASDMPETFSGYHFLAMDSDEINAFGAPSGFVLASRGLLRRATSEEEVAAILAHEIGHVTGKHGLKAIKSSRWTEAVLQIGKLAAQSSDSAALQKLTVAFGDSISDIVKTMVTSGYSRDLEKQADLAAVAILQRVGYDPAALVRIMRTMKTKLKPGGKDFAKTHPDPAERITYIEATIKAKPAGASTIAAAGPTAVSKRQERYKAALGKI
jgi:predicted Zn-dependent protease